MRSIFLSLLSISLCAATALAVDPAGAAAPASYGSSGGASGAYQASNVLNPNVSAIGWFQGEAGHRHRGPGDATADGGSFSLKETEIGLQAVVDPWARADFFVSVGPDSVDLEEGYITWFQLPADLSVKAGKFKANLGRFNRIHTPETPFADRPLVQQNYLGDEGLNGPGLSVSWHVPNPWIFLNLDVEGFSAPKAGGNPSFERTSQKDNVYVSRLSGYYDLSESWNVTAGGAAALGHAGESFDAVSASTTTQNSRLYVADLTFRWKNIRRSIYHSFLWSTEALWSHRDELDAASANTHGFFTYADYQFAQRWHAGARYDYSQFPTDGSTHEEGRLVYVTVSPSEFSQISLQGRQVQRADGIVENLAFLKTTFNIGPHGAHPF